MEAGIGSDIETPKPTDEEIATLAYRLWNGRGCPAGSPDDDWFQAETELKNHKASNASA
jgi:hypothetical protein